VTATADSTRKERERDYHNRAFSEGTRSPVAKYYEVTRASREAYHREIESRARGARVLEVGCGPGSSAFRLARAGARVTGIDISDVAIGQCTAKALAEGIDAEFRVMDAERLEFAPGTFDVVCGTGILHHLDLDRAFAEVARVLRPAGCGVFIEPMGHNLAINLYRRLTPSLRTADEHPLRAADRRTFCVVEARFFHLSSLAAFPFARAPGFGAALAALDRADRALFRAIPFLRRYAWVVVLRLAQRAASS
jgi:SAM-dependent methyltransferase